MGNEEHLPKVNCLWIVPTKFSAKHDGLLYLDNDFTTVII